MQLQATMADSTARRRDQALSNSELCANLEIIKKCDKYCLDRQSEMSSDNEGTSPDLFPGIPNDVTVYKIAPKLSWRDLHILSLLSRAWCHAIRSRQVYNARVHQHSGETLVLVSHSFSTERYSSLVRNGVTVYSMRDNTCYELPPIPGTRGFPEWSQSVSLDGKIYVLGGYFRGSCKVYVLDLIGQKEWKQCANMIEPRSAFGCGVMNGKIYVFGGGVGSDHSVSGAEVYDSKKDIWTRIRPLTTFRYSDRVENMGDEFLLHDRIDHLHRNMVDIHAEVDNNTERSKFFDVYNPAKDEWREIKCSWRGHDQLLFLAGAKLHQMELTDQFHIRVHNYEENSWTDLHSSTFVSIGPVDSIFVRPLAVLAVNEELLAVVYWRSRSDPGANGYCLVRSKGFGTKTKEIMWQKAFDLTHSVNKLCTGFFSMHSFEL